MASAKLFAVGGKRAVDETGKLVGIFTLTGYVGNDPSSQYVVLTCSKCGTSHNRNRNQLQQAAKAKSCASCRGRHA